MDSSKKKMGAVKKNTPITQVGHTSHRFWGRNPNARGMTSQGDTTDEKIK